MKIASILFLLAACIGCAVRQPAPRRTIAPADCSAASACPAGQVHDPLNCACVAAPAARE